MLIYKIPPHEKEEVLHQRRQLTDAKRRLDTMPTNYNTLAMFKELLSAQTSKILRKQRCLSMNMRQFNNREHINKNMCCVEFTESVHNIENGILAKLAEIKQKMQVKKYNNGSIPLPIYVSLAKIIERDKDFLLYSKFIKDGNDYSNTFQEKYTFQGKMNIIIYVPNLMNNITDYTFYPSLEAYTNQNKWMELMTHPSSYFLKTINNTKNKKNNKYSNLFKKLSDDICDESGCISDSKEDMFHILYKSFFLPTKCLQNNKYEYKNNMKVKLYNIYHDKKKRDKGDNELQRDYDNNLKELLGENQDEDEKNKQDYSDIDEEEFKDLKIEALSVALSDNYRKNIGKKYNKNILEDLGVRNIKPFPGVSEITLQMYKLDPTSSIFKDKINFHYMPWGDKLINNQYVLNENKTFYFEDVVYNEKLESKIETKLIKFKSLNEKYFMMFNDDGKLSVYDERNKTVRHDIRFLSNIVMKNEKNKHVNFDSSGILYFHSDSKGEKVATSIYYENENPNPCSIILDENNPGNLLIYGLGFQEVAYS
jgi:hypothetical protein